MVPGNACVIDAMEGSYFRIYHTFYEDYFVVQIGCTYIIYLCDKVEQNES